MKRLTYGATVAVLLSVLLIAGLTIMPAAFAQPNQSNSSVNSSNKSVSTENEQAEEEERLEEGIVTRNVTKKYRRVCEMQEEEASIEDVTTRNQTVDVTNETKQLTIKKQVVRFEEKKVKVPFTRERLHIHNETVEEAEQAQEEIMGKKGKMKGKKAPQEDEQATEEELQHIPHVHKEEGHKVITKKIPHVETVTETVNYTNQVANVDEEEQSHEVTVEPAEQNQVCKLIPLKGKKGQQPVQEQEQAQEQQQKKTRN